MQKIICILLLIFSPTVFAVDIEAGVKNLPLDQCKLQKVIDILTIDSAKRSAEIASSSLLTIQSLAKLTSKAKISNQPLSTQLSPNDNWKFAIVTQRLTSEQLAMLIESMYQRDLSVIKNLIRVDDQFYNWDKIPDQNDPDAIYFLILIMLEKYLKPHSKLSVPTNECSLSYAISVMQSGLINQINQLDSYTALHKLQEIKNKYTNLSEITPEDKNTAKNLIVNVIEPTKNLMNHINDLESIKQMARISKIMYESYMNDILNSGGDINSFGNTLNQKVHNGDLSKEDDFMIRLWIYIDGKLPSQMIKDIESVQKTQKQK